MQQSSEDEWGSALAEQIVLGSSPTCVLCVAPGMMPVVHALQARGVETHLVDILDECGQHQTDSIQSIALDPLLEALNRQFDLIICGGFVAQLSPPDTETFVEAMCERADDILFVSVPVTDQHIVLGSAHAPDYWSHLFAKNGFFRDVDFDASFVARTAARFRRAQKPVPHTAMLYERTLAFFSRPVTGFREIALQARARVSALNLRVIDMQVKDDTSPAELYIDLLKKCLTRWIFLEAGKPVDLQLRSIGNDWPAEAETMIGMRRLDNLQYCVTEVIDRAVPGDLIETGVWRGGSTIFMRGILKAYGDVHRSVWVADSFVGLPKPDPELYRTDAEDALWTFKELAVSLDEVQANFARYGLLDSQVRFLPGFFRDTLSTAPIERLAVLRLDGDMYESTMDALDALYPKLSVGGFVIVDDYGAVRGCKAAVDDFRAKHGIMEEMQYIDWTGVFWRRLR